MQSRNLLRVAHPLFFIGFLSLFFLGIPFTYASKEYEAAHPGKKVYYFLNDHLGSVDKVLDSDGNVVEERDFLPYGEERVSESYSGNKAKDITDHKFTGKELDDETGLYYYGARYYDPLIGRFTSIDPLVLNHAKTGKNNFYTTFENPQNLNAYSYAGNNPIKYNDPTGLWKKDTGEVEKGDTLSVIVKAINKIFDTSYTLSEIATLNKIENPDKIYVGQKIMPNLDIPEITKTLQDEMQKDANDKYINNPFYFKDKFRTGGDWDLKNRENSIYNVDEQGREGFVFQGEHVRYDFPGNALFGYIGKAAIWAWDNLLLWGAGKEQGRVGNSTKEWQQNGTGDDPTDRESIKKGFELYETGF